MMETTMIKRMAIAALAALALTGCGTAATPAPTATSAVAAPTAGAKALKTLPAAAVRKLMSEPMSTATLWGLDYRYAYEDYRKVRYSRPTIWAEVNGRLRKVQSGKSWTVNENFGWYTDYNKTDEGDFTVMDAGRFLYKVPSGRMLVISRILYPGRVTINGFDVSWGARETKDVLDEVNYVFGPGEIVQFAFPTTNDRADSRSRANCNAKLSGFTADPALFGGSAMPSGAWGDLGSNGMAK